MTQNLSQADLSNRSLAELSPDERLELKRRFARFMADVAQRRVPVEHPRPAKPVRKWVPGMKR